MFCRLLLIVALLALAVDNVHAADWSRFRGPDGNAYSAEKGLPTKWSDSAEDGLVWKTSLPGAGASSPVIAGDKVFVTCFKGTVPSSLERILVCASRKDGKILWEKSVKGKPNEDRGDQMLLSHGYSSSTPATDGEGVYVLFGKSGVYAYDMDGKELWHTEVGNGSAMNNWGSACSPIIYKNLVIVNAAAEGEALVALDKKTGKEVWKNPAKSLYGCWGTPILVDVGGGKQELVLSVPGEVWGFEPATGEFLWFCEGVSTNAMCTSAFAKDGIVYAIGGGPGGPGGAVAIKAGGKDDVTKTHLLWTKNLGSYVTSPVVVGEHLFWINEGGIARCLKLKDGALVIEKRVAAGGAGGPVASGPPNGGPGGGRGRGMGGGREYYASVVGGDGKLYAASRNKGIFVLSADAKMEVLANNKMDDASIFNAGPAIQDGQIYLRSDKFLYCIGKK